MKKRYLLLLFIVAGFSAFAQNLVNDAGTVNIAAGATLAVNGNITNSLGGVVNNAGVLEIKGNYIATQNSTQTGNGIYRFNGTAPQFITIDSPVITSVEIDNPAGLSLGSNIEVLNKLIFINGNVYANSNELTMATVNNSVVGASSNRFFVTGDAGVFKYENVGNTDTAFYPIGYTDTTYNPLTLVNNGIEDNFSVRVFNDVLEDGITGPSLNPLNLALVPRTWVVTEDVQGGTEPVYTFQWEDVQYQNVASTYYSATEGGWRTWLNSVAGYAVSGSNPYTTSVPYASPFWPQTSNVSPLVVGNIGPFFFPESVNENIAGNLISFPNPVLPGKTMQIGAKQLANKAVTIMLYNSIGGLVAQNNQIATANGIVEYVVPQLAKGIYLLAANSGNTSYTTRLVVE